MALQSTEQKTGLELKSDPGRHGHLRGVEQVSESSLREGTFGRMFRHLEPAHDLSDEKDAAALHALGEAMKGRSPGQDEALGASDSEENDKIPAGYTYLAQFVDHDLTYDPVASFTRMNDPEARTNFRTPRFDLDSLYGRGPAHQPYLYQEDDCRFLLGQRLHDEEITRNSYDLPRAQGFSATTGSWEQLRRALIGDPRNDQNLIVSQLHSLFLEFHNAQVREAERKGLSGPPRFLEAQRLTRWHYQWIVLHDFLPKVVDEGLLSSMLETIELPSSTKGVSVRRFRPALLYYGPEVSAYIPVEFSVAAYRFGHSMIRPTYHFNHKIRKDFEERRKSKHGASFRMPILAAPAAEPSQASLVGSRKMPEWWAFDWDFFFKGGDDRLVQPSYRIDTFLSEPLYRLTEAGIAHDGIASLADRTLFRGAQLGLPSGESVAELMGLRPLDDKQLFDRSTQAREVPLAEDFRRHIKNRTPLWYYILREAEYYQGGERLGPVGSRIVGEVLVGLLFEDKRSFVNLAPGWEPPGSKKVGGRSVWGMRELIDEVKSART